MSPKPELARGARLVAPELPILADLRTAGPFVDPEPARLTRRTVNRRLEGAAMGHASPRAPQEREALAPEPAPTVDVFFALEDFARMAADLVPPEFAGRTRLKS